MSDDTPFSKADLVRRMDEGWNDLNAFIDSLTETQITQPTDAAGWTVKDHLAHLAIWEDGVRAMLQHQSRLETMGVDQATWDTGDFDKINAVIQRNHRDQSWAEVRALLNGAHLRMMQTVRGLSEEDLQRPHSHYQPGSTRDNPIYGWIISDSYDHYAQHIPWMQAIANAK